MPRYQNPHSYVVSLVGPDGKIIKLQSRQIAELPEYFEKYKSRGFLRTVDSAIRQQQKPPANIKATIVERKKEPIASGTASGIVSRPAKRPFIAGHAFDLLNSTAGEEPRKKSVGRIVVGSEINRDAIEILGESIYPISNNIGVGILAYERAGTLKRLIESIKNYTDLNRTTVFISDDGSENQEMLDYLGVIEQDDRFVVIRNQKRLGVAGNSNRLLRALSRFRYGLILNDDIEILKDGWEHLYVNAMNKTGYNHLIFRKSGVYDADLGANTIVGDVSLNVVKEKPHGALLAFTNKFLETVGAFDQSYGYYGLEHVDWSMKAYELKLQPLGFFDVTGSDEFVTLHHEKSTIVNKSAELQKSRTIFSNRSKSKIAFDKSSSIPSVTYVVPFREQERSESLGTVINNIRAQRYPDIEIILCEQDFTSKIDTNKLRPIQYQRINLSREHLFNKSMAFNKAVFSSSNKKLILHDADMMAVGSYTKTITELLDKHGACHLGNTVIYADAGTTKRINNTQKVDNTGVFYRVVGYFEGGSFGINKDAFAYIGGYNEEFFGYGNEDTEFYSRMSALKTFYSDRASNFVHLYHGRTSGWTDHHRANKMLEEMLFKRPMDVRVNDLRMALIAKGYNIENINE